MRATETKPLATNQTGALADGGVTIYGGKYALLVSGTPGTGSIQVKTPHGDWVSWATAIAAGYSWVELPAGQVRANLDASASGAYVYISRIPND